MSYKLGACPECGKLGLVRVDVRKLCCACHSQDTRARRKTGEPSYIHDADWKEFLKLMCDGFDHRSVLSRGVRAKL